MSTSSNDFDIEMYKTFGPNAHTGGIILRLLCLIQNLSVKDDREGCV